jgi:predicted glycosyltransferase
MRVWMDFSASAHPIVLRPAVERMRARGHEVEMTARDYAQTLDICRIQGLHAVQIGEHGGAGRLGKLRSLTTRTRAMKRFGRGRDFDLAVGHGSNDLALAARSLGIPAVNMFDYEWATLQHNIGCRCARRVLVPEAIPPERLRRYGARDGKLVQYPGLKEEYYLWDFEPDPEVLPALGVDQERVVVIVRPPPDVSLYHRKSNQLFPQVLQHLGSDERVHAVVLPRTDEQRAYVRTLGLPSLVVPDHGVDGQSAVALADLVVSAGGSMNREAVALGTPVYTTYGGRLGGVDEALIRDGRLRPLTDPRALELVKQPERRPTTRRDPELLVELMLEVAA